MYVQFVMYTPFKIQNSSNMKSYQMQVAGEMMMQCWKYAVPFCKVSFELIDLSAVEQAVEEKKIQLGLICNQGGVRNTKVSKAFKYQQTNRSWSMQKMVSYS